MKRILLVENDQHQGTLYEKELRDEGYDVLRAGDGPESISLARREHPDVVVMDVHLPGMDGLETMSKILSEHPQLPVILNSAYSGYQDSFLSWSAQAYVQKSSDLTELKTRIREALAP